MHKGIVGFLAFSAGGVLGFVAGKKLLEQHYDQVVREEIESVKEAFRKQRSAYSPNKQGKTPEKGPAATPSPKVGHEQKDYRIYYPEKKETKKEERHTKPYVIPPVEFDTILGYETISLTMYADGTVTDDDDQPMTLEDVEETVGQESLKHFGEYEEDSVFVRNDEMRTDYEILRDERDYEEMLKSKPYLRSEKN